MTIQTPSPRILLIDSYDSFTFNLASLIRLAIPNAIIHIIQNDSYPFEVLRPLLHGFSAIVVGPGPGSPTIPSDIGVINKLWTGSLDIPIFGVCLGLQSLAVAFGGQIRQLTSVKHGETSTIRHSQQSIFKGISSIVAVRYHSLFAVLDSHDVLKPLAWANDPENGEVIMGLRHTSFPFYAVQYHPESVSTEGGGLQVLSNFWNLAQRWNFKNRRPLILNEEELASFGIRWPFPQHHTPMSYPFPHHQVETVVLDDVPLSSITFAELLGANEEHSPFAFLDSAADPGRFAIIVATNEDCIRIQHFVGEDTVRILSGYQMQELRLHGIDIWQWCRDFMLSKGPYAGHPDSPFWGGLIGILSYEAGLASLSLQPRVTSSHPDVNLIFAERSIVLDTRRRRLYVQSLRSSDDAWLDCIKAKVELAIKESHLDHPSTIPCPPGLKHPRVSFPDKDTYISAIHSAKRHLSCGDSYEICLTAQTSIETTPLATNGSSTWKRYKRLRSKNPAPHSSYIRLSPTTVLSSSPERFLSFSRPPNTVCQLRPIKGTLRKSPGVTLSDAHKLLKGSVKEVAENRMIVDLILHDLRSVLGTDVKATKFCGVEEYQTVYQLVSVIEGRSHCAASDRTVGWNVLQRSLPPGSMTGAPKKRSVQILQNLENTPRGVYSGVIGYWCVSGAGDWSVTIRTATKLDEDTSPGCEKWTIGAGGAITALSDPEAEWDEMKVKLESALQAFTG